MATIPGTSGPDTFFLNASPTDSFNLAGGVDSLIMQVGGDPNFDLTSSILTSVEKIISQVAGATFTVDQADLIKGGSVIGSSVGNTLLGNDVVLDLTSTTLTNIQDIGSANNSDLLFKVDLADIKNVTVTGNAGGDTLFVKGASFDLTSTDISGIETLRGGSTANTFTLDAADVANLAGGDILGGSGKDTLIVKDANFDISGINLSSVETLKAGAANTTFTVNPDELLKSGTVTGSTGTDTLAITGTMYDLTSTTISSVEHLQGDASGNVEFLFDAADLTGVTEIDANGANNNTVFLNKSATFAFGNIDLNGISELGSSAVADTLVRNFTFGTDTLAGSNEIIIDGDSNKADVITGTGTSLDLSSAVLDSIENLKAGAQAITFTLSDSELNNNSGGTINSVTGSAKSDILAVDGTGADLTSVTLSSVETLQSLGATATFTVDQADLAKNGTVDGTAGDLALIVNAAPIKGAVTIDLSSTTLTSVESLSSFVTGNPITFKLGAHAIPGEFGATTDAGTVHGDTGSDIILATGTQLDLTSTVLDSIENLTGGNATGTKFIVDLDDLTGVTLKGGTGKMDSLFLGTDGANAFDVSALNGGAPLTGIEGVGIRTDTSAQTDTAITVSHAQLVALKSFTGNFGSTDSLQLSDSTDFNLLSATLSSIETLNGITGVGTNGTTFTIDAADIESLFNINGTAKTDALKVSGGTADLFDLDLNSIETLSNVSASAATTFILGDDAILTNGAINIKGGSASDTIQAPGDLDLTSATLTSIENLKETSGGSSTAIINDTFLKANGGSLSAISGTAGGDNTLEVKGVNVNLTSTTLASVEHLQVNGTTITLDQADIFGSGQTLQTIVDNSASTDTLLQVKAAAIDLSHVELQGIDILQSFGQKAGGAITYTVSEDTFLLNGDIKINGGTGTDVIKFATDLGNLESATLNSIEQLVMTKVGSDVLMRDLDLKADGGSVATVTGTTGHDFLGVLGTDFNVTSTTLTSIEGLYTDSDATTFTVNQSQLLATGSKGTIDSIEDNSGQLGDVVQVNSNTIDVSKVEFHGIETLKAAPGVFGAETFIVSTTTVEFNSDLNTTELTIVGGSGSDTLVTKTDMDFADFLGGGQSIVHITDIENLQFGQAETGGETFVGVLADNFGGADGLLKVTGTAVKGSFDDLGVSNTGDVDLTSTTFTQIEGIDIQNGGNTVTVNTNLFDANLTEINTDDLLTNALVLAGSNSYDLSHIVLSQFDSVTENDTGAAVTLSIKTSNDGTLNEVNDIVGTAQDDTLVVDGSANFVSGAANLTSIEKIQIGTGTGATLTVEQSFLDNLASTSSTNEGTIAGNSGVDTLDSTDATIDLTSTSLSSIETLHNGSLSSPFAVTLDATDLISLKTIDAAGVGNGSSLLVTGNAFDLSHTALLGIDVLNADATAGGTIFTLDQADVINTDKFGNILQHLTTINGDGDLNTIDTIQAAGSKLDLTGVTLNDIEAITASHGSGVQYTLDSNAKGISLDLTVNSHADVVTVTDGYLGQVDNTSSSTIEATDLKVANFQHGQDTIDLSALTQGTASTDNSPSVQGVADSAGPDLLDVLNTLGNLYDGSADSKVVHFELGGNTYVFVDNSDKSSGFDATHDSVVELTGTGLGLTDGDIKLTHQAQV